MENTYDFISTKTDEVYSKYANTEENTEHAKIAYWKKLITLILVEMKEDKMFYEPIFNRFVIFVYVQFIFMVFKMCNFYHTIFGGNLNRVFLIFSPQVFPPRGLVSANILGTLVT